MELTLEIIRYNGQEYLCCKDEEMYVNISNPMVNFTKGEDEFEIVPVDPSYQKKVYRYREYKVKLKPAFYSNGWLGLYLHDVRNKDNDFFLTVNLETTPAFGLPANTFIDCNNESEAMAFLIENGLATDLKYSRKNGFVDYPMVALNLPLIYQHEPQVFKHVNI